MTTQPSESPAGNGTSSFRLELELELARNAEAPAIARAAVAGRCESMDLNDSICQTLILLVSEVVTNAVLHSPARVEEPILMSCTLSPDAIRITVIDAGKGFQPKPRDPGCAGKGYGLYLLEKAARRWGVDSVGGTRVWFELARPACV